MPDQITSLDNQPTAPVTETLRTTGVDNSEQQSDLIAARSQLVRQFIQLLSQSQGQLPPAQEQKLQPLLRQMIPQLSTGDDGSASPLTDEQMAESKTLSQLIQRVAQQLPTSDPLLKNLILATPSKATAPTNPLSTAPLSLLEQAQVALSSQPNTTSADTKTLGLWLLQLLVLRTPSLARDQASSQPELKLALAKQSILLPDQALLADKLSQSKLLQLGKATVQFMQSLMAAPQTGTPLSPPQQEKSRDVISQATTPSASVAVDSDAITPETSDTMGQESASGKRAPLLERVGASLQQLKASILGTTAESKSSVTETAAMPVDEQTATTPETPTQATNASIQEPKTQAKTSLSPNLALEPGKSGVKGTITPISDERGHKSLPQAFSIHELVQTLQQQAGRAPEVLRPIMQSLSLALQQPLTSDAEVREWISFVKAPLDDNTPLGRNLRQWGTTLLAIRFGLQGQLSTEQHKQLNQLLTSPNALQLNQEEQASVGKLAGHFLNQMEKMQQQTNEPSQLLPGYIPLPCQHTERRESGISQQANTKADGSYEWSLNFSLDLGQMGALQIRVKLDLPDLQMQLTAEKMSTVDKIKETLPLLEQRFKELGLQPVTLGCRQGKVSMPQEATSTSTNEGGLSIHI